MRLSFIYYARPAYYTADDVTRNDSETPTDIMHRITHE